MEPWIPAVGIARHRSHFDSLSDDEFLARLRSIEPLPDEDDEALVWTLVATFDHLELLLAAADSVGARRLVTGIPLIYQRAGLGEGFGHMQGLRHGPEAAVGPSGQALLGDILRPLVNDRHAGCRRWSTRELGILRSVAAYPALVERLRDPVPQVRGEACSSLAMIAPLLELSARRDIAGEVRLLMNDHDVDVAAYARTALTHLA